MIPVFYKSLVRPVLKYGHLLWGPFHIHDQIQIEPESSEKGTFLVITVNDLPYTDPFPILNLSSLTYRCRRGGMIFISDGARSCSYINVSNLFTSASYSATRGCNYRIFKPQSSCLPRHGLFAIGSVIDWNSLSDNIVSTPPLVRTYRFINYI